MDAHLVGPTTIGACDPALFTASSSTGAGGRPMRFGSVASEYDAGKILGGSGASGEYELVRAGAQDDLEPGGVYAVSWR